MFLMFHLVLLSDPLTVVLQLIIYSGMFKVIRGLVFIRSFGLRSCSGTGKKSFRCACIHSGQGHALIQRPYH